LFPYHRTIVVCLEKQQSFVKLPSQFLTNDCCLSGKTKSSWWNRQPSTGGYIFFTGDFKAANGDANPDPTDYWSIWIDDFGTV